MASRPNTPPPPRLAPSPGKTSAPASKSAPVPQVGEGVGADVLTFEMSRAIRCGASSELTKTVRFHRAPGLGELEGWLDESSIEDYQRTLETLPFRPGWQRLVLARCAKWSPSQTADFPLEDVLRFAEALGPFVSGSRETGEAAPSASPNISAGGLATLQS